MASASVFGGIAADERKRVLFEAAILGAAGLVFLADALTPLGIEVWLLYMPVILLASWLENPRRTLLTAAGCSMLVVAGVFLSPPGMPAVYWATNRVMGLSAIWVICLAGWLINRQRAHLTEANAALEREMAERRHAEEALRESEERLRLALDAGEMGTWDWDLTTDALTWSERQFDLFGIRPEEFQGRAAQAIRLIHPEDRPRVQATFVRSVNDRVPFSEEFRVVQSDGGVRWLAALGEPVENSHSRAMRIIGINFDISDRKRAEETLHQVNADLERRVTERTAALQANQEHLAAILRTAADAIVTIDEHGIIQSINAAAERMFGYTAPEMIGQNVSLLMPSPYREDHDGYLARYARTGESHIIGVGRETVAMRKDGSVFQVDLTVSQINQPKLITGILRDITRRKELEREVVEIVALEQQRIGQDLHDDCGQELTALGLLADSLVDSLHQNSPADLEVASKIEQGLRRVLRRVRSLSRGLVQMEVSAADLPDALLELTSRLGETSGVRCTFHGDRGASITNDLQATHLYHIAQEACTNALKHGQARNIHIHLRSTDSNTVLEIQNDGLALPEQFREGLGMRILRNRANVIGARLTLAPGRFQGTVVTCLLPRERAHVPES